MSIILPKIANSPELRGVPTRFRAYQLGEAGANYSYFDGNTFTLIEARRTADLSHASLESEMKTCGKTRIDTLHITSWDVDHCKRGDLEWILENLMPSRIEYPGYTPHHPTAIKCLEMIKRYRDAIPTRKAICIDPPYIDSLNKNSQVGYTNLLYHPKQFAENSNDNSTVQLFRTGSFNVASLGDIQSPNIGSYLRSCRNFRNETDILILPHHGAASQIITKNFLDEVKPHVAIAVTNHGNQYGHPDSTICNLLSRLKIPLYTTKRGDVIVESTHTHTGNYSVSDHIRGTELVDTIHYVSKKRELLSRNADSIRSSYHPGTRGPRH